MKATIEETSHLTRDEITAVESIASTINTPEKCKSMLSAIEWLQCLSGWFIYRGGDHVALMKKSGDSRRIMIVTAK